MKNCSFSSIDRYHQLTFSRKTVLRNVEEDEKTLLGLRSDLDKADIQTICCHHEQLLDVHFSKRILMCSDPFREHLKPAKKSLKIVNLEFYNTAVFLHNKLVPGEKCISCSKQAAELALHGETEDSQESDTTVIDRHHSTRYCSTSNCSGRSSRTI